MSIEIDLESLTERVAEHTIERDMENEDWEKAVAINGLFETSEERFTDAAVRLVDRVVETQTSAGEFGYGPLEVEEWELEHLESGFYKSNTETTALGHGVLEAYDRTGETRYLDAARRHDEFLADVPRTGDGGISMREYEIELWVDAVYFLSPFYARYGRGAGEPAAFDRAVHQAEVHAAHLKDPATGLYRHEWRETPNMYPESTFWSRGNGWMAAALVDTLEYLPDDHEGRPSLRSLFEELADSLLAYQDRSGFWHHILDDPETPLETSGTLMFAYAFRRALDAGYLEGEAYADAAERALRVSAGTVDERGAVRRVAVPPGGPEVPMGVTSFGQGWFLLAAEQFR